MTVRELIKELQRYDPNALVKVRTSTGSAPAIDVGRRERYGQVEPQIYIGKEE